MHTQNDVTDTNAKMRQTVGKLGLNGTHHICVTTIAIPISVFMHNLNLLARPRELSLEQDVRTMHILRVSLSAFHVAANLESAISF